MMSPSSHFRRSEGENLTDRTIAAAGSRLEKRGPKPGNPSCELGPLHDRYIIDDSIMVILGTSLNGFGKKQCFVIQTGQDLRSVLIPVFDGAWNSGIIWP